MESAELREVSATTGLETTVPRASLCPCSWYKTGLGFAPIIGRVGACNIWCRKSSVALPYEEDLLVFFEGVAFGSRFSMPFPWQASHFIGVGL